MDKSIFYDFQKVFSYNSLLNIIIGERGVGKTYGIKKHVIKRFKKTKRQFAYIRRYETDLDESVGKSSNNKFFEQIKKEFPDDEFKISKSKKVRSLYINGEVCGYALPLSSADSLKSSTYEGVDIIIYDECALKEGSTQRYLKNEPEIILDLIETIGRLRDIKIFCICNAISSTFPLMLYFDLSIPYNTEIKTFKDGLILVNYIKNERYRAVKKASRFGKLIEGTRYAEYSINNKFLTETKTFIKKKTNECKFYFIFYYNGNEFGVWIDRKNSLMYISYDIDPNCPVKFAVNNEDHNNDTVMVKIHSNGYMQNMIQFYRLAQLCFESQKIKNLMLDFLLNYVR